jgi:hypothetical protein
MHDVSESVNHGCTSLQTGSYLHGIFHVKVDAIEVSSLGASHSIHDLGANGIPRLKVRCKNCTWYLNPNSPTGTAYRHFVAPLILPASHRRSPGLHVNVLHT